MSCLTICCVYRSKKTLLAEILPLHSLAPTSPLPPSSSPPLSPSSSSSSQPFISALPAKGSRSRAPKEIESTDSSALPPTVPGTGRKRSSVGNSERASERSAETGFERGSESRAGMSRRISQKGEGGERKQGRRLSNKVRRKSSGTKAGVRALLCVCVCYLW